MGWPKDAYVGQEVVCVMHSEPIRGHECPTKLNQVYKISSIKFTYDVIFSFEGINSFPAEGFHHRGFRPLEERKTPRGTANSAGAKRRRSTTGG